MTTHNIEIVGFGIEDARRAAMEIIFDHFEDGFSVSKAQAVVLSETASRVIYNTLLNEAKSDVTGHRGLVHVFGFGDHNLVALCAWPDGNEDDLRVLIAACEDRTETIAVFNKTINLIRQTRIVNVGFQVVLPPGESYNLSNPSELSYVIREYGPESVTKDIIGGGGEPIELHFAHETDWPH